MKRFTHILIPLLIVLQSCATFKSIKCGNPSTDTYLNFALDTISSPNKPENVLISTPDHDRYFEDSKFSGVRFNNETVGEYFSRVRGDGALLIVRNDTVLLEQYYGNFSELSGETGACWDSMGGIKQCRNLHFRAGRQG